MPHNSARIYVLVPNSSTFQFAFGAPRFGCVFSTLTQADSGRTAEHFQLTISSCPLPIRFPPGREELSLDNAFALIEGHQAFEVITEAGFGSPHTDIQY